MVVAPLDGAVTLLCLKSSAFPNASCTQSASVIYGNGLALKMEFAIMPK